MFPRIAIIGSGAIGTYYGVRLALAGADVRFLLRSDYETVRARGSLRVKLRDGLHELRPAQVFRTPGEIGPVDLVIITLKTTANAALPALLPPLLGPDTALLTLQNGLGSDESLAAQYGAGRVLGGLAFIAVTRTGPGEVTCHHPGTLMLGEFGRRPIERTRQLALQFDAAGVKSRVAANLLEARWRKLVWNIPFNGLAIARGGITTDKLCADPVLAAEVRELMREVQHAAAAFGFTIPDEFLKLQFEVTPPMGAYPPSSLVDFLAGREVEVDAIWGEPLRRAQAVGVNLPKLAALHAELRRLCM
jgi:2-dehydropantoate 2-reductase